MNHESELEVSFLAMSSIEQRRLTAEHADVLIFNSFPELGMMTALRFIEFVQRKPTAVCSLPTGKTPEYFMKWVVRILTHWESDEIRSLRNKYNISNQVPPQLSKVRFVQIDEFVPINPSQSNSYYHYIEKYYMKKFGLEPSNCLLMDTWDIIQQFPSCLNIKLDLSLRHRDPVNELERDQRQLIIQLDSYCADYERKIQALGGIDLFLGGIGPDGHVGFNIRDSDPNCETRLLHLNYESLASSAAEAHGGMSNARRLAVITIGLKTIRINPNCTVIIFAAGESKSKVVKDAIEECPNGCNQCGIPSHALRSCRLVFYLTVGSAKDLKRRILSPIEESIHSSISCKKPIANPSFLLSKLARGAEYLRGGKKSELKFLHTEPHHDDIVLGYLPFILRGRSFGNKDVFVCCTSGFNSVANSFISDLIEIARQLVLSGRWELAKNESFKFDLEVFFSDEPHIGSGIRFLRNFVLPGWSSEKVLNELDALSRYLASLYPGQKHPDRPDIESLKGQCREFESDCVWHKLGWDVGSQVHHLRMGFYTSDLFAPEPVFDRDAAPIYRLLLSENPDVITVALDPESSGPDTHYKVLQAVTAAVERFESVTGKPVTIWGYRNVWYTFEISEADLIFPVSVDELNRLSELFLVCYQSQKTAEFPSYQLDGPFSALVEKQLRNQLEVFKTCIGGDGGFSPDTAGALFIKEMSVEELKHYSRSLRQSVENI